MWQAAVISWLYVWGAVSTTFLLAYANSVNSDDGKPAWIGAIALAALWPLTVPLQAIRWTLKFPTN
jgi:hypothetical protein